MKHKLLRSALGALTLAGSLALAVPGAGAHGVCRHVGSDEIGTRPTTCARDLTCRAADRDYTLEHGTEFRVDDVYDGGKMVRGYVRLIDRECRVLNGYFH